MDVLRYLSNRHIDVDALFTSYEPTTTQTNYNGAMSALGHVLEKQVRTWWDICSLEQYIKEKVIIRSLRWDVTPQDGLDDQGSMQEWLDFFNGVGFKLQQLVLQRKKRKMANLESRINDLQQQLDPIKDSQQIIEFNARIQKKLEKVDRETQKKKLKKYHRDLEDFKKNSIYSWQQVPCRNEAGDQSIQEPSAPPQQIRRLIPGLPSVNYPVYTNDRAGNTSYANSPIRCSTPIQKGGRKLKGNGRRSNQNGYSQPNTYDIPTHNRFQPLQEYRNNQENYANNHPHPRPFLGRGRGRSSRGRNQPRRGGRPHPWVQYRDQQPQNNPNTPYWKTQHPQRKRDPPQYPQSKEENIVVAEQDLGPKKRRRESE